MQYLPKNIPPKIFTASAVVVAYILMDDTSANEQNALGNWLMLAAQVLCTNAAYKQFQQGFTSSQSGIVTGGNNNINNNNNNIDASNEDTIKMLTKMVNALNSEINEIKKDLQRK